MMRKIGEYLHRFLRSIFGKIWISQIILIFLPVAVIGSLSFYVARQIINYQLIRLNTAALNQVEGNLSALVDKVYQMTTLYMVDWDIENALRFETNDPWQRLQNIRIVEDKITIYSLLFGQLYTHTMMLGKNGFRYLTKNDDNFMTLAKLTKAEWYPELLKAPNRLLWLNINPGFQSIPGNTPVITLVKAMENQRIYGFFFFSLEESLFYDVYKNVPGSGSQLYIVNGDGMILSHNRRSLTGRALTGVQLDLMKTHRPAGTKIKIYRHDHRITLIKKVHNMNWYIFYSIPETNHYQIISGLKGKIALIACLCFLLAAIIAFFIARSFSTPLVSLTRRIRSYMPSLSPPTQKTEANTFEIDLLNLEYDMLIQRLDDTIQQLLREQEEKRKAEFHALQMQINPHFLYNTLNSIKCLVWTKQIDLIEPTLTAFIKLLRRTVGLQDDIITLADEIENIRNYVYIYQIRTGKTIDLNVRLAAGLEKCKLPKLLLQPIIENAIFHGIEPKNTPNGTIGVTCIAIGHKIAIEIQDNGIGMDQATIAKIMAGQAPAGRENFSGIGVPNIDARIKLLYGSEYGLTVKSEPGLGTLVIVTLPEIY
jgi:two-component system sensor histidine kinase YesM